MTGANESGKSLNPSIAFDTEDGERLVGEVVDADDAILGPDTGGQEPRVPMLAIDQLLKAAPDVATAVHGGKVMRVIGGPAGPLWQVDGGVLATVRTDKGIVGHLRFAGPPEDVRVIAAPAAAFQLASAVTLQYYLNTITKQLESLQRGIGDIKHRLADNERAEIEAAEHSCSDVARHMAAGSRLRTDDLVKLNAAHDVARRRFAAARDRLDRLAALIDQAVSASGDIADRKKLRKALVDGAQDGVRDYDDLMHASVLMVRALGLLTSFDAEHDPSRLSTSREGALRELDDVRQTVHHLSAALSRLNIRSSAIEREWTWAPHKWGSEPYAELEAYRTATKGSRLD